MSTRTEPAVLVVLQALLLPCPVRSVEKFVPKSWNKKHHLVTRVFFVWVPDPKKKHSFNARFDVDPHLGQLARHPKPPLPVFWPQQKTCWDWANPTQKTILTTLVCFLNWITSINWIDFEVEPAGEIQEPSWVEVALDLGWFRWPFRWPEPLRYVLTLTSQADIILHFISITMSFFFPPFNHRFFSWKSKGAASEVRLETNRPWRCKALRLRLCRWCCEIQRP